MGVIRFLLGIVVSAGFVAMGLLMLLWPATYFRWVRSSTHAPWLVRRWEVHRVREAKIVGIALVLFGITAVALWVYIFWFQRP